MEFIIECPWCNQHYSVDESFVGQNVECSVCGKQFAVRKASVSTPVRKILSADNSLKNESIEVSIMSRNIVLAIIAIFLTVASVTGCGNNQADNHANENKSVKDSASGEITVILPGNVTLTTVKIEAGSFEMSANDGENFGVEVPHRATLTKDFFIGKTEVTQAQWKAVMDSNPSEFKGDDLPVEKVSWNDAMSFCEKLNSMDKVPSGWKFTLPTETQWEYAARGGKKSKGYKFSGSNTIDEVAWYYENSGVSRLDESTWDYDKLESNNSKTHSVGQKKANELGLYDMSGNVEEWCLDDWQKESDRQKAEFTRCNDIGGPRRVRRGGSWCLDARSCRSAGRGGQVPNARQNEFGFRVVLVQVQ